MKQRKKLKLTAMLLAAAIALQLGGCAAVSEIQNGASLLQVLDSLALDMCGEKEEQYVQLSVTLPRHPGYAAIEDKTAYECLDSDEERQAYLSMEQSVFRITDKPGEKDGTYKLCRAQIPSLSSVQIFKVKEAVLADHPEAFWLNGEYDLGRNAHDGLYIVLYSSMTSEEITTRSAALAEKVSGVLRQIQSGLNEYDREMIIHDCIVRDVQYDEEVAANASPNDQAATVYGAMVNGRAICTGYARTVKLLLNRVGISCMTVKGVCRDEGHMWNLVSIDGSWYHLDATWNDPVEFSVNDMISHNYFNLTDADIASNHNISPNYSMLTEAVAEAQGEDAQNFYNFDLPACTSDEGNFYKRNAVEIERLNDSGEDAVIRQVRLCSLTGGDMFYLIFPESMEAAVIEEWFKPVVLDSVIAVNRENKENGTGKAIDTFRFSQVTEDNWCNVFIFKLLYEEQDIS